MATKTISYQNCLGINTRKNLEDIKSPIAPKPYPAEFDALAYEVSVANNIDIDAASMPSRRNGFEALDEVPTYSLWANHEKTIAFCVRNSFICRILLDLTFNPLREVQSNDFIFQETPDGIYASNGQSIYCIKDLSVDDLLLVDQPFKAQMPACTIMEYFRGRLYAVVGKVLWFSDAFRFFKRDMRTNFKVFPYDIDMVAATIDGLYVSAGGITYFLVGDNPHKFDLRSIAGVGAIRGSRAYISGTRIKEGLYTGLVPVWATPDGICYGYPAGKLSIPTASKYIMPTGSIGASLVRPMEDKQNGYTQIISTVR